MRCQSQLFIYGSNSQIFVPGCGEKPAGKYQPASGIPVKERWEKLGCGLVQSVTLEPGEYRSTPVGSATQRLIISVQISAKLAQINFRQGLFAQISDGIGWKKTAGMIEDFLLFGSLLRLIINPAKLVDVEGLCKA